VCVCAPFETCVFTSLGITEYVCVCTDTHARVCRETFLACYCKVGYSEMRVNNKAWTGVEGCPRNGADFLKRVAPDTGFIVGPYL